VRAVTLNTGYSSGDFTALLASRQFAYADAITIRLNDGSTVLAYTDAQQGFTVPPCDGSVTLQTYVANDILVSGLKFKASSGGNAQGGDPSTTIEVDEQTIIMIPNANGTSLIGSTAFLEAVREGVLDAATIQRDRWYFDGPPEQGISPTKAVGGIKLFYGFTASVDSLSRTQASIKVKSDLVLLNRQMPRNLYQPNCQYTVYSTECGAVKSGFVSHGTVGSSPTTSFIPWASATTQFTLGTIEFQTGPNTNQVRTIRKADATGLWLAYPLPSLPLAGDTFAAYPGCDRQYTGGCAYFGRQAAYRGFQFTPNAEMAV
jgi:uncharacterized phage protein (TIGR02218 family)